MFDNAAIGIALVDAMGQPVHNNPALQRMLGYTAEELRRMSFVEFTHPDDTAKDWALAREVFEGQRDHYQIEKRYLKKDGQVLWGHLTASAIRDGNGNWQFGVGMVEDITERKQAEEAIHESEERFRQLTENIREVFWMTTPDLSEILYISPAYETVWGRTRESLYQDARSFIDAIHPDDRPHVVEVLAREQERGFAIQYRVIRPDSSMRWIWDRGFPVKDQAGRVYRLAGIAEDITERKQAEEQLRATSAQLRAMMTSLQSAREQEGTRIAREIHDELGSALTSLRWDLEAIEKTISEVEDRSLMPAVRDKIGAMVGLIDTTMHVVRRISSELRPPILDDLGLAAAIEWQTQQFQARTGIICRYDGAVEHLDLDQEQSTAIFRIFQEALTNVLRHAQATRVNVTLEEEEAELVLTIRDNGRGITEGEQGGPPTLGLLGMRERAHLIGGRVDLTGVSGQGTTVTLRVPHASD
jgi:PAS domain S-box-containing protein